jgi:hypothetical protein
MASLLQARALTKTFFQLISFIHLCTWTCWCIILNHFINRPWLDPILHQTSCRILYSSNMHGWIGNNSSCTWSCLASLPTQERSGKWLTLQQLTIGCSSAFSFLWISDLVVQAGAGEQPCDEESNASFDTARLSHKIRQNVRLVQPCVVCDDAGEITRYSRAHIEYPAYRITGIKHFIATTQGRGTVGKSEWTPYDNDRIRKNNPTTSSSSEINMQVSWASKNGDVPESITGKLAYLT